LLSIQNVLYGLAILPPCGLFFSPPFSYVISFVTAGVDQFLVPPVIVVVVTVLVVDGYPPGDRASLAVAIFGV
jgi:hypothetical protein